ncbi:MAG: N-acetylmuramoyl-L-alanine amidase [Deltaproteobacteria bacterium]|nr:N-acetylmuramoyl-L-alanine amidase [Deltaproteobacteria bacterium]
MQRFVSLAVLAFFLASCSAVTLHDEQASEPLVIAEALRTFPAQDLFAEAGAEYDVPADLLAAIAWKQSSFAPAEELPHTTAEEGDGHEHRPAHGWMGLTDEQVTRAGALTGLGAEAIEYSREENVFAAAALLDALRNEMAFAASPTIPNATWWRPTVAFVELDEAWLSHAWARDVFETLQRGLAVPTLADDVVEILPRDLPGLADVEYVLPPTSDGSAFAAGTDYPGAARFTAAHSSNQSYRANGAASIQRVVIHTVEGSYGGAISWFRNPSANVSAHYVVRKSDGEVTQMVRDARKGWHVCGSNNDTIGIEHEGAAGNAATWTPEILDASARLTAWLVTQYNIPIDRNHIVGHGEIQGAGCAFRSDPGVHFPWSQYMQKVQNYASGGSSAAPPPADLPDPPDLPSTPTPPPSTSAVSFQSPRDGDVVANPVQMRILSSNVHHVNVYVGPYLVAENLTASPVHVGVGLNVMGSRTLKVKGYSASGAVLATDTVTVDVVNAPGQVSPVATQQSGMTYQLAATSNPAGAYVRYWVDGWPLTDTNTGSSEAPAPDYGLTYTFGYAAYGRQLVARSYDAAGNLLGEGFSYIDVNSASPSVDEEITAVDVQEAGGTVMYLQSAATAGVAYVEYWIEGYRLTDMATGATRAEPNNYSMWYQFNYWGERQLEVRAYDANDDLVDTWNQSVWVPAPQLEVTWQRLGTKAYRFDADAPAGTDRVVIEIDDWALPHKVTGNQWAVGPQFLLPYDFNYGGYRSLRAQAFDSVGNVLGTYETMIQVY